MTNLEKLIDEMKEYCYDYDTECYGCTYKSICDKVLFHVSNMSIEEITKELNEEF